MIPSDPIVESSGEESVELTKDESEEQIEEAGSESDKTDKLILSSNRLPQDQMKFIVIEEAIRNKFGLCSKCRELLVLCP